MKTIKSAVKPRLASAGVLVLVSLLVPVCAMAQCLQSQPPQPPPTQPLSIVTGVPNVVNPGECELQREGHFLTFIGSFIPEDAASSSAYYAAIDPGPTNPPGSHPTKPTFPDWLKNAGFISDVSQW